MHHVSRKLVLTAVAVLALASIATPALGHRGKGSGKKATGTIASFDGTTLTVTTSDGSTTATVTDDSKIRVEHRGHHGRGKGHGNPSKGTAEDLTAGAFVLKMKTDDDGTLDQIHIRPAAHEVDPTETPTPEPTETPDDETDDADADETEDDADESEDDADDEESDDDDDDDDEDESDEEDDETDEEDDETETDPAA